jgi:hypothetical protein
VVFIKIPFRCKKATFGFGILDPFAYIVAFLFNLVTEFLNFFEKFKSFSDIFFYLDLCRIPSAECRGENRQNL